MTECNILVCGDGAGVTSYLTRHLTGEFPRDYQPSSATVFDITFPTTHGPIVCHCFEHFNQQDLPAHIDAIMVFFDRTNVFSFTASISTIKSCYQQYPQTPIIWLSNKCDIRYPAIKERIVGQQLRAQFNDLWRSGQLVYYLLSAKSNYNFEKPFLHVLRTLTNDNQLNFTEITA